jgi:hypothetical protein
MKRFILALVVSSLFVSQAEAGIFSRFFNRGCAGGNCAVSAKPKAAAKYKYECKNGVCRRVEVK